jgi:hypothetical protein
MLLQKVRLVYLIYSFFVCIKVFVSCVITIELMQQFSFYMQMTSAPDTLYNMKSLKYLSGYTNI